MNTFFGIIWHILRIILGVVFMCPFLLLYLITVIWGACIDARANQEDFFVCRYNDTECRRRKATRKENRRNKNLDFFKSYFVKMFT